MTIKRKVFGLTKLEKELYIDTRMTIALELFAGEEREARGFALMAWKEATHAARDIARKALIGDRLENDGMPVHSFSSDLAYHAQDCACAKCRAIRADNA